MCRHHPGADVRGVVRLTGLLAAIQFLTRIPIRLRRAPDVAAAVPWFPVVGVLDRRGSAVSPAACGTLFRRWLPVRSAWCGLVDHRRLSRGRPRRCR
jgi:hypothetical protein